MKIIYVISPDYLDFIYEEAKGYDFYIQGYKYTTDALDSLIKTNISEVLGFVYVSSALPQDLNPIVKFLKECDMLCHNAGKKLKFLFALQDMTGIPNIFSQHKFSNLKAMYLQQLDVVTDETINQQLFGSILLDNYSPYVLKADEHTQVKKFTSYVSKYSPLFGNTYYECLAPVDTLETVEQTMLYDKAYQKFSEVNSILAKIREFIIRREFGLVSDTQSLLQEIQESSSFCMYRTLLEVALNDEKYTEISQIIG